MSDSTLLLWLQTCNATIQRYESEATAALYERNDEVAYRASMEQKALLLSTIAADAAPLLANTTDDASILQATKGFGLPLNAVQERLESFSAGAKNALKLRSVFYMSALLYPDDHKTGEPNNLERLLHDMNGK